MRSRILFLGITAALGLAVAIGTTTDLAARCRCERGGRASERKAARQDKRAARRGDCSSYGYVSPDGGGYNATPSPGYNPYGVDQVQTVGAAASGANSTPVSPAVPPATYTTRTEYRWQQQCGRGGCTWVSVPYTVTVAVPPKPVEAKAAVAPAAPQPVPDPAFGETKKAGEEAEVTPAKETSEEAGEETDSAADVTLLDAPTFDPASLRDPSIPPLVAGHDGPGSDVPEVE